MSRRKRTSSILEKAQVRFASMSSIQPAPRLGEGLSLEDFSNRIAETRQVLGEYNAMLSHLDELYNRLVGQEATLRDLTERMLAGVGAVYGKDSSQYEMAGGVRKSERKPRVRKAKAAG